MSIYRLHYSSEFLAQCISNIDPFYRYDTISQKKEKKKELYGAILRIGIS